jgi:hypothetical protein
MSDDQTAFVPTSDPYVEALDAVFNLKGCQKNQDARVGAVLERLTMAETMARSRGLKQYSERAHHTFDVAISDVLRVLCHPDFDTALSDAQAKVERLRVRLEQLSHRDSLNQ